MSLEDYIESQGKAGAFNSTGSFKVHLEKALEKLQRFTLGASERSLLKLVQLGCKLRTQQIDIELGLSKFALSFKLASLPDAVRPERVLERLMEASQDSYLDLSTGLLGALSDGVAGVSWCLSGSGGSRTLRLGADCSASLDGELVGAEEEIVCRFCIEYAEGWKFWKGARRRLEAAELVRNDCCYCGVEIRLDGQILDPPNPASLNSNVEEFKGSSFNAATGVMQTTRSRVAASNLVYLLASEAEPGIRLNVPSRVAYAEKKGPILIFKGALRGSKSLEPDGDEIPSWMIQFVSDGRNLRLSEIGSGGLCKAVIAMNLHGPGSGQRARVIIVRQGVKVGQTLRLEDLDQLDWLRGCTVVLSDDTDSFDIDIGGLSVVGNEKYYRRLAELKDTVAQGQAYFSAGDAYLPKHLRVVSDSEME